MVAVETSAGPYEDLEHAPAPSRPRRRRRRRTVALLGLVAVAAGGLAMASRDDAPTDDRLLVADGDEAVALLDPETGEYVYEVPGAVVTPDRSALLTTRSAGDETVLESHDPGTGEVTGSTTLAGALTVRTVSPQGGAVALMPGARGEGLYSPEPRAQTSLTVSYTDERAPRSYELDGNF